MSNKPLDVLEADGSWLTAEAVAHEAGMTDNATQRALYRLRNDGKVETRIRDDRNEWRYVEGAVPDVDEETELPVDKRCSSCKETKSLREFGKNRSTKDGHSYYCKPCTRAKQNNKKKAKKKADPPAVTAPKVELNGWRDAFTNPTLDQLEKLRDLVGVSTLDEAAAISKAIAGS